MLTRKYYDETSILRLFENEEAIEERLGVDAFKDVITLLKNKLEQETDPKKIEALKKSIKGHIDELNAILNAVKGIQ